MSNLINNNQNNLTLKLNTDEYWDFFVCKDAFTCGYYGQLNANNKGLSSYFDFCDEECVDGNFIVSKSDYSWENAISVGTTLKNIGLTGLDNGLIQFRKDRVMNQDFANIYLNSEYSIDQDDVRLKLHEVSGSTLQFDYPLSIEDCQAKLNGGFYQGFFKTKCDEYQVLPSSLSNEWTLEFVLTKSDFEKESDRTLNDKYPNNKGIFFYIGTRAENKWDYLYTEGDECELPNTDDYVEDGSLTEWEKHNVFTDMSLDMEETYLEADALVFYDYTTYKYYDNKLYEKDTNVEDYFFDDYLDFDEKPLLIDEEKEKSEDVEWCCGYFQGFPEGVDPNSEEYVEFCNKKVLFKLNSDTEQLMKGWYSGSNFFDEIEETELPDFLGENDTDYFEDDIPLDAFTFETDNGFSLNISNQYKIITDNKFLLFNRTCTGFTINTWVDNTFLELQGVKNNFKGNLFLLMNRTCTGYTVNDIEKLKEKSKIEYNVLNDLYNNALAFRITDDGAIGYRYLVLDCESDSKYKCEEGYSKIGLIENDKTYTIKVKITPYGKKMKLYFYINGKLKFISKELPKLNLRELNDLMEKQEGVAYNISLGGGTQGLCETILPTYMTNPYRTYPLEENFAGSFIGYLQSFKFFT